MNIKTAIWHVMPARERIYEGLCRRLAKRFPNTFAKQLQNPIFVVGFNNGGKSTIVRALKNSNQLCVYPYEGNQELWFHDLFPWITSAIDIPPIWHSPEKFVEFVTSSREDNFLGARAHLGAWQWLLGGSSVLNDSGMLAALLPDILPMFPDARFIHIVRDGKIGPYLSARMEWSYMMRSPPKYQKHLNTLDFQTVLEKMMRYWAWTLERVESVKKVRPKAVFEVRYEEWCADPDKTFQGIANFLKPNVVIPPASLDFAIVNMNAIVAEDFSARDKKTINRTIGPVLSGKGYPLA